MPKLSIIIVNYNTRDLVLDCLKSITQSQGIDFGIKVIVVDNASTDGSAEALSKLKWITYIPSPENKGFAHGNNLARNEAEGEYVWFLNPDTAVEPNTIAFMIRYMDAHPEVGISTPKLILPDGSWDKNGHRGIPTLWNSFTHFLGLDKAFPASRLFSGYYLGFLPSDWETEVDAVGGSSLLIRRELLDRIGWWDEAYFMYGEDIDLSFRVRQAGFKVMFIPDVIIHHYHGAASGVKASSQHVTSADSATRTRSILASTAAMRTFYKKHQAGRHPAVVNTLVLLGISLLERIRLLRKRI